MKERVHILGMVETWFRGKDEVYVEGYKWWGINRVAKKRAKRGSGGVGVLVRDDVWPRVVLMEEESDERMMWIRVRAVEGGRDRYVGIVYGECNGVTTEETQGWLGWGAGITSPGI